MKFKKRNICGILFFCFLLQNQLFAAVENAKDPFIFTANDSPYVYDGWIKNDSINDRIQIASSHNYGYTWNSPINLSSDGQNAKMPFFTCDTSGKYVYAIWVRYNGSNDIIQFSKSQDYAQNFLEPQNLSSIGKNALSPDIITNSGENLYAIWARSNGSNDIIQFSKSEDFGDSFSAPVDLSAIGRSAKTPKIATNSDESKVCAIWARSNGSNDIIQFKHSSDYGVNWSATIDLSEIGSDAKEPQVIVNNNSIYAIWARQNNGIYKTQFRKSTDNGSTFSEVIDLYPYTFSVNNPKIVTNNDGKYIYVSWYMFNGTFTDAHVVISRDYGNYFSAQYVLSKYGKNSKDVDITTNIDGKQTYVVWVRFNGYNDIVQIGRSNNYGSTWTKEGKDLSLTGNDAKKPKVMTSNSGRSVYVSWSIFDGTKDIIQAVFSNDYGFTFSSPVTVSD